jgi:glycyl-tRNA synthetase
MKFSGKDLSYLDEERWERDKAGLGFTSFKEYLKSRAGEARPGYPYQFVPHVIEPSAGADRGTLAFLCEAYTEDTVGGEARTFLKFHPRLAPLKAAVFPLVKRDGMPELAENIYLDLKQHFNVFFDEKGAIGRRYRRQDEAGTPFGITVDSQTLTDGTVTFRDRDSCRQWRVPSSGAVAAVRDLLAGQPIPDGDPA